MILVPQYEFPVLYNVNYLNLLVRDPNCIFAYWEVTEQKRREVTKKAHGSKNLPLTLRVYDLTGVNCLKDAHSYFDLSVHPLADNYFITKLPSNRSYCVELGLKNHGSFLPVLRSNVVQTPLNRYSDGSDVTMRDLLFRPDREEIKIGTFSSHGIYGGFKNA